MGFDAAVLGALVADAASLGLHWIYDPSRIAEVAGDRPEFFEPDVRHYKGVPGYCAHRHKHAGDSTHYGEQLLVLHRSMKRLGRFDALDYEQQFVRSFGPGGTWVGYIDYATRETLRRIDAAEVASMAATRDFDLSESERPLMVAKVMANVQKWRGDQLAAAMEKAVRITHPDDDALVATGQAMARAVEAARVGFHGSDDVQLPAVAKLPALTRAEDVEPAVRVTNDNDEAVRHARVVFQVMKGVSGGATPREAVRDNPVEGEAGLACPLPEAVPLIWELLADATGYQQTIRANILKGGDSAGRAIILGAVCGLAFGVPDEWAAQCSFF